MFKSMIDFSIPISTMSSLIAFICAVGAIGIGWSKMSQLTKDLKENLNEFKADIKEELKIIKGEFGAIKGDFRTIKNDIREHDKDIAFLKGKKYSYGDSPLKLNDEGARVFRQSKIGPIIDERKTELLQKIQDKNPDGLYDVQEFSKTVLEELRNDSVILKKLKDRAYNSGVDIDIVLFVGSLYLRNIYRDERFEKKE